MSAAALLSELRRRDVHLRVVGSELRCSAPAGALTPELRDQLRQYKNDVMELLASAQAMAAEERAIVPLQRSGTGSPIFAVPGHNGDVFCYRALARSLGEAQPFFGLQPPGVDGEREALARVEHLAAYFAEQIRSFAAHGPYIIAGYCAGGTIAFELAQQLHRAGATINFVALFGSPFPAFFRWPLQLRQRLTDETARLRRHTRKLAAQSWRARPRYLAEKLKSREARRSARARDDVDPVLLRRAAIERTTLAAVRRYRPTDFPGTVHLFLPSRQWAESAAAPLRWRTFARDGSVYFGPDGCERPDMLREPTAPVFAELLRPLLLPRRQ